MAKRTEPAVKSSRDGDSSSDGGTNGAAATPPKPSLSEGNNAKSSPKSKAPTAKRGQGGRYLPGTAGGPGRKPARVEREYLATLASELSLSDWAQVCRRAIRDARRGCDKARSWLSKYVLPPEGAGATLLDLAVAQHRGETTEQYVAAQAALQVRDAMSFGLMVDVVVEWAAIEEQRINAGLIGDEEKKHRQLKVAFARWLASAQSDLLATVSGEEDPRFVQAIDRIRAIGAGGGSAGTGGEVDSRNATPAPTPPKPTPALSTLPPSSPTS